MKNITSILLILVMVFSLVACGEAGGTSADSNVNLGNTLAGDGADANTKASSETRKIGDTILDKYVKQYDAKAYYQDMLVTFQYVLVTDSQLISLNAIEGAEDIKLISIDEIAIAQSSQVADIYTVTITSKNGDTITIRLSESDAGALLNNIGK